MKLFVSPHIRRLIELAIDEDDLGFDVTSNAFFSGATANARLLAKQDLVLCGTAMVHATYDLVDRDIRWEFSANEGDLIKKGEVFATASGDAISLLTGERTALNFLQRMTGVATQTRRYADALAGSTTSIVDTRKTLPGYRELDKYSVRVGGGKNHRYSLAGGVMVKDNHIAAAGSVKNAVEQVKAIAPHTLKIEVEVERIDQIDDAVTAGADIIMLDNMSTPTMVDAIAKIRALDPKVVIEASGNITIERLAELKSIGLDVISSGALTHSVYAADISMKMSGL